LPDRKTPLSKQKCFAEKSSFETEKMNTAHTLYQALFLTPATEKTKTQAQNSSQKLKEKTQTQGDTFLLLSETQEKNSFLPIDLLKLKFSLGLPLFLTFI